MNGNTCTSNIPQCGWCIRPSDHNVCLWYKYANFVQLFLHVKFGTDHMHQIFDRGKRWGAFGLPTLSAKVQLAIFGNCTFWDLLLLCILHVECRIWAIHVEHYAGCDPKYWQLLAWDRHSRHRHLAPGCRIRKYLSLWLLNSVNLFLCFLFLRDRLKWD